MKAKQDISTHYFFTLFSKILNAVAYYKIITDDNGKPVDYIYLEVNDNFERMTGLKRERILGKRATEVLSAIQKDPANLVATYGHVALTGESIQFEEYKEQLDKWFNVFAYGTEKGYFITLFEDITERKKAEEALRETRDYLDNLLNYANAPIIVWDPEFKITKFNHAFERLTGLSSNDVIDKHLDILFPKDKKEEAMAHIQRTLAGEYWQAVEISILRKDGTVRTLLWNSANIYDSTNQRVVATIAQGQDVTEQKRLQEELVKSEKLAAIGQLASAVGHEIRNPLGVIKNSTYFLNIKLKPASDEKVAKHLKILEKEVNSANIIISDLLDFARKKTPVLDQADLNETVKSALSYITIPENIKVEVKLGEIPKMLLDKEQVQRVCQNLILNAVQAMSDGGKLTIQTTKQDDSVKVMVRDTGVGIPKENMPKLFAPLFSTKAKGIGLGLTICKQIVEDHGGTITVESEVAKGSTFTVKLPIRTEKEINKQSAFTVPMPIEERVMIEK